MKANKKFRETNKHAVSNVIGFILMVAITIAAAVYLHFSSMLIGVKDFTASIACITDSSTNRVTITSVSANLKWSDILVVTDNTSVNWGIYNPSHTPLDTPKSTSNTTAEISSGDYVEFDFIAHSWMSGNVQVTLIFVPTNTLLGSWILTI